MKSEIKKIKYTSEPEVTGNGGRPTGIGVMQQIEYSDINNYISFNDYVLLTNILNIPIGDLKTEWYNGYIKIKNNGS